MFELRRLSSSAIPAALEKAMRYRLLNEPGEAESICRDILELEPTNQEALSTFILVLTDQFPKGMGGRVNEAIDAVSRLEGEYTQAYHRGIILERRGKCQYRTGSPACGYAAYDWLRKAMEQYDEADRISPEGNDDAVLRWNACARLIMSHSDIQPEPEGMFEPPPMLE